MTTTTHVPPQLYDACNLARFAMASAIEDIDLMLDDDSAAIQYPTLIAGYMAFAGAAYAANIGREAPGIN